ncbi:serine hydrolase [Bradyrhizobium prioriisuperbiae]|uniref:serine hydrolase n=1 Tax=Bradyrhizobium prioriisuperbiae TaxID=2854389 RepID=UPI0028EBCD3C|nr:serine hydrolase [Bradyrhizobium prioritasuperba]
MAAMVTDATRADAPLFTDADIRKILIERIDIQKQSVGIVVGLVSSQGRRIIAHGHFGTSDQRPVDGNTVYEIGSITKVFTGLLLADMVGRGEVRLDDAVARYLPDGVIMPERDGKQITLVDLATHTSALPLLPDNMAMADPANPYADYTVEQLYTFLSNYQLPRDIGSAYEYSNLGAGLLGHALARRAGTDYETLVRQRILSPLGMASTAIALPPQLGTQLAAGHDHDLQAAANWDLPTLAGAGALRATANDLLTFLEMTIALKDTALFPALTATLATRRAGAAAGLETGLGWAITTEGLEDIIWHTGGTGGYQSFIGFLPASKIGVVVLSNSASMLGAGDIGFHLIDQDKPLAQPPKPRVAIALDPKLYDRYVGRYQLTPDFILTVTHDGKGLFAQPTGQPKVEVFAESETDFFLKEVDAQLSFETSPNGRATGVTLHQQGQHMPAARLPD